MISTVPYTARKHQEFIHHKLRDYRWSVLVCHRRFGKTVMMICHLIMAALENKNKNPRFAYISPTFKQSKSIAWDYIKQFTYGIPGIKYNETELRVDFPNGARITLLGSENCDGIRGIYLDGCVIDEYANVNERLFPEIIRPALSDRKGFCVFIGTPQGMNNNFYELYQHAQQNTKDWFYFKAKASKTQIVDEEELEKAKAKYEKDRLRRYKRLEKYADAAYSDKQYASAINAEFRSGQLAGLYVDKREVKVSGLEGMSRAELEKKLTELSNKINGFNAKTIEVKPETKELPEK